MLAKPTLEVSRSALRWMEIPLAYSDPYIFHLFTYLKEHSVQTASRALKDGADEELVVCGLFHDIGELLAPICHGEVGEFNFIALYFYLKVIYT